MHFGRSFRTGAPTYAASLSPNPRLSPDVTLPVTAPEFFMTPHNTLPEKKSKKKKPKVPKRCVFKEEAPHKQLLKLQETETGGNEEKKKRGAASFPESHAQTWAYSFFPPSPAFVRSHRSVRRASLDETPLGDERRERESISGEIG